VRKKKPAKRKSAGRKMNRGKKPIRRKQAARSKTAPARIHQGVGPQAAGQSGSASGFPDNDGELGGES
jgi:hypothetical protein